MLKKSILWFTCVCTSALLLCSCARQPNTARPNYTSSSSSSTATNIATTTSMSEPISSKLSLADLEKAVEQFQGEYKRTDESGVTLIISGTDVNFIIDTVIDGKHTDMQFINNLRSDSDGNIIVTFPSGEKRYNAVLDGDILKFDSGGNGNTDMEFKKVSDNTEVPPQKVDPKIGMTKEDILNKTWAGEPYTTGILTTENGTAETWYYEWGDISFVDDVVVLINEGTVNVPPSGGNSEQEDDGYIHIGDSFIRGNIEYTFVEYDRNYTDYLNYCEPKSGYKYIWLHLRARNIGTAKDKLYTLFFDCYADNKKESIALDVKFNEKNGISFVDGDLSPNRETEMALYYEIPQNSKSVEIEFAPTRGGETFVLKCE